MKFFAATLLAVAAAAVKIQQDDAELPPPPKCPPPPSEDAELEDIFDLIDADGSGDIDEDEGLAALYCAGEYGMIDDDDVDGVIKEFKKAAGEDGKVDMGEAKRAVEGTSSDEGDELAQEKQGPKPDGSGSDSGSDSGPDSEDLKAVADELDLDSEDVDALLDGELAQKSGPGSGPGSEDLPSDLDSDALEKLADEVGSDLDLAQEEGKGPKCPTKDEMEAVPEDQIFDLIDTDDSGDIDEKEGKFALGCAVKAEVLSKEEAEALGAFLEEAAKADGDGDKLSKAEAEAAFEELEAME